MPQQRATPELLRACCEALPLSAKEKRTGYRKLARRHGVARRQAAPSGSRMHRAAPQVNTVSDQR